MQGEIATLKDENDKLVQHQNAKQKLQYHVKIKQENNDLKEEIKLLKEELIKISSLTTSTATHLVQRML